MIFSHIIPKFQKLRQDLKFSIKPTLILFGIYLIAISALLRANYSYIDDVNRELWGTREWGFSRYVPNILSIFIHGDSYVADISPLTQILAIFIVAFASTISLHVISEKKEFSLWQLFAAIPIGLSPFFLQCLSYKYDSPYMALSILFSVLPLLACKKHWATYAISIILCTILMASAYQAASGIFPILVIILGLRDWLEGKKLSDILKFYGLSAAAYLLGLVFYNTFMVIDYDDYASTALAPLSQLIPCVITNYKFFLSFILYTFDIKWGIAITAIYIGFVFIAVYTSKQKRLLTVALVIFATVVMVLLCLGVYPFLLKPIYTSRSMYGIGCLIAFWGIYAVSQPLKFNVTKIFCFGLSWMFFTFCLIYGNALSVQADYTTFRIQAAIDDLSECSALRSKEPLDLKVTGSIGYAPGVENLANEFPMLDVLLLVMFEEDYFGEFGIRQHYNLPSFTWRTPEDDELKALTMISDSYYHTIYANDHIIWIDLH